MQLFDPFIRRYRSIDIRKLTQVIAAAFFVIGSLLAYVVAGGALASSDTRYSQRLDQQAASMRSHIKFEFAQYEQMLEGAAAFAELNQQGMTRELWAQYIEKTNAVQTHPAMLGMGYVDALPTETLATYESNLQNEYTDSFNVFPAPDTRNFTSISYLQPENSVNRKAIGFDMSSESTRRAAMTNARDTGKAALSAPVQLVQDGSNNSRLGVLMYQPMYEVGKRIDTKAQRIDALTGYVYVVVRPSDVAKQIDRDIIDARASFAIRDNEKLVYESNQTLLGSESKEFDLSLYGAVWQFTAYIEKNRMDYWLAPVSILLGGILISGLLAIALYRIMIRRINYLEQEHDENLAATKNELVMLASHQLRTPASGVKQYLGMLVEGMLGPMESMQESIVKKAYDANERQIETIDQILHVAKADAGQLALQYEKVDLTELLNGLIDECMDDAARKNISVKARVPAQLITWCDKRFITMAIENLLSNAIKYSYPDSTVRIVLKVEGKKAVLAVSDKGVGIPEHDAQSVFDKFVRIDNPLSVQEGGTGLGLFLAREIARAHKGSIRVSPNGKKGSVFTLRIPLKKSATRKSK